MSMNKIEDSMNVRRFLVFACEVLHRELCFCAARSSSVVDIEFLSQGYHDLPSEDMCSRIQKRIDSADESKYDAVLLGFALCNNGISGISAAGIPLVVPKAHDCITLLLGSRNAYRDYFDKHPGTYFLSAGWMERDGENLESTHGEGIMNRLGLDRDYEDYVREYGKEAADYIMENVGGGLDKYYDAIAFIDTGMGPVETHRKSAEKEASERGFGYFELKGNTDLLQNLLDGMWTESDFLVLQPGETLEPSYDDGVIRQSPPSA